MRTALALTLAAAALAPAPFQDEVATRLIGGAISDAATFGRLRELTDTIGPRLSGSRGAANAVQWAAARFREDGVDVRLEPALVPHWVRGEESGQILPARGGVLHPLALTALGNSAPTPPGGLTAEVVEAHTLEEAAALKASGRIVLFQHDMKVSADYGRASNLRTHGAAAAAKAGAAAMLVRSAAVSSMRSPHTGVTVFDEGQAAIPAAAIALEDAELIHRLLRDGPVTLHLELGCQTLPDAESNNVVAEVRGREKPDEVVLLGAHLDSWDLATGAIDDGAGVAMLIETMRLLARLPEKPRRTVRAVLYMNEENGSRGSKAYAKQHAAELSKHVAAIEMDSGGGRPIAVNAAAGSGGEALLRPWLPPLLGLGISELGSGAHGGADVGILGEQAAVPFVDVRQEGARYFEWHHSAADTLDKIDPQELARTTAALAWVAYALAESEGTLARVKPEPRK